MTAKLGKLDYSKLTLDALARWAENGAKKPKREYGWRRKVAKKAVSKLKMG